MTDQASLRRLLLDRAVQRGSFLLSSGQRSSYYIDCRRATMSAEGLTLIGRLGLEAIRRAGWRPDCVGGLTMGADPVACAIAAASYATDLVVDAFSVRKASKDHGTGQLIEGSFRSGHAVVIVEDVITSGASARQAVAAVEAAGGTVLGVLGVVDREEGGRAALEREGRVVVALTSTSELGLRDQSE